jgi:hypothetical protein
MSSMKQLSIHAAAPLASMCWLWTRTRNQKGYGLAWHSAANRLTSAHRMIYELLVGPIPEGMQLDHICRQRGCVNPDHMRVVTQHENTVLAPGSRSISARNASKTHCLRGHPFDEANTYYQGPRRDRRGCRICKKLGRPAARYLPNVSKTHCPWGHLYDEANTYHYRGGRWCRACMRERAHGRRGRGAMRSERGH